MLDFNNFQELNEYMQANGYMLDHKADDLDIWKDSGSNYAEVYQFNNGSYSVYFI